MSVINEELNDHDNTYSQLPKPGMGITEIFYIRRLNNF